MEDQTRSVTVEENMKIVKQAFIQSQQEEFPINLQYWNSLWPTFTALQTYSITSFKQR
jgi:hypothetical protein